MTIGYSFLKSTDNTVFETQFIDFEGSSAGTAVLSKENPGKSLPQKKEVQVLVYPNPTHEQLSVLSPEKIVNFYLFGRKWKDVLFSTN